MKNLLLAQATIDDLASDLERYRSELTLLAMQDDGRITVAGDEIQSDMYPVELAWFNQDVLQAGIVGPFSRALVDAPGLEWMQTVTAGLDHPMFRRLLEQGARLSNSDAQAPAIAEYVVGSVLNRFQAFDARASHQADHAWVPVPFREIYGSEWLIIGFGNIGQRVGRIVRGFSGRVTGVKRSTVVHADADRVVTFADLDQEIPGADVIVLACALTETTQHLVDEEFLARVKPGTVLVNIARGGVVDEPALLQALDDDRLDLAILDVFEQEPLPADSRFWSHERVHLTPHASNRGGGTRPRGRALFLENLEAFLAGRPLRNEVDLSFFS